MNTECGHFGIVYKNKDYITNVGTLGVILFESDRIFGSKKKAIEFLERERSIEPYCVPFPMVKGMLYQLRLNEELGRTVFSHGENEQYGTEYADGHHGTTNRYHNVLQRMWYRLSLR